MNLPNKLTLLRIILVPIMASLYWIAMQNRTVDVWDIASAAVFTVAAITDLLDGHIARKEQKVTLFGKFVDPIADKLLVMAALVLLAVHGAVNALVIIVIIGREFVISGFRLIGASKGIVIAADWSGKIKTVLQDVAIVFLMIGDFPFNYIGIPMGEILIWISAALSIWSCGEYMWKNKELLKEITSDLK